MAANNVNRNSHAKCTRVLLYLEVEVKPVFGEANLLQPRRKQKNNQHMGQLGCRGNPKGFHNALSPQQYWFKSSLSA